MMFEASTASFVKNKLKLMRIPAITMFFMSFPTLSPPPRIIRIDTSSNINIIKTLPKSRIVVHATPIAGVLLTIVDICKVAVIVAFKSDPTIANNPPAKAISISLNHAVIQKMSSSLKPKKAWAGCGATATTIGMRRRSEAIIFVDLCFMF